MEEESRVKILELPEYNSKYLDDDIKLAEYFPAYKLTLSWYEDVETVKMVDNANTPYDID